MKKILILSNADLSSSPRERRQIKLLSSYYEVISVGRKPSGFETRFIPRKINSRIFRILRLFYLVFKNYERYYWTKYNKQLFETLKDLNFDLIIAHEIDTCLPLAIKLKEYNLNRKVILDAHEYSPDEYIDKLYWRLLFKDYINYLHKKYLHRINDMFVVSNGIGEEYKKNYGINSIVITNASDYQDLSPSSVDSVINIVHHGIASSSRNIESMIHLMDLLDERFHLNLMLVANDIFSQKYIRKLKSISVNKRVKFVEPVVYTEICERINEYDIGLINFPPIKTNYKYVLPNKFFEFVQARLALAIGPSIEIKNIVQEFDIGVVAKNFSNKAMAEVLNGLTKEDIIRFKEQSHKNARMLSSSKDYEIILSSVQNLITK